MADIQAVAVFGVGTWNGQKFVDSDLEEIVNNTNALILKGELLPPLKLGHSTNQILQGQSDGDPRLGSATNFAVVKDKIVADFKKMPDIIVQAIKEERFNQVSVEMRNLPHFGWFIHGIALLGGDLPAVKTLEDLSRYLSETIDVSAFQSDNSLGRYINLNFADDFIDTSEKQIIKGDKMGENDTSEEMLELRRQVLELDAKNKALDADNKTLSEKNADRAFAEAKEKELVEYRQDVKDGKLKPAMFDKIERHYEDQRTTFGERGLSVSSDLNREINRAYAESLPKKEQSHDNADHDGSENIDDIVEAGVYKVMADTGIDDYIKASDLYFKANPRVAKDYHDFASHVHGGAQ